jgi:hypothetical protein
LTCVEFIDLPSDILRTDVAHLNDSTGIAGMLYLYQLQNILRTICWPLVLNPGKERAVMQNKSISPGIGTIEGG